MLKGHWQISKKQHFSKIKNSTNNNYKNGGLKNVFIAAKIGSLQSSWIKRFAENFHNCKILPLHVIHKALGKSSYFILTYK